MQKRIFNQPPTYIIYDAFGTHSLGHTYTTHPCQILPICHIRIPGIETRYLSNRFVIDFDNIFHIRRQFYYTYVYSVYKKYFVYFGSKLPMIQPWTLICQISEMTIIDPPIIGWFLREEPSTSFLRHREIGRRWFVRFQANYCTPLNRARDKLTTCIIHFMP